MQISKRTGGSLSGKPRKMKVNGRLVDVSLEVNDNSSERVLEIISTMLNRIDEAGKYRVAVSVYSSSNKTLLKIFEKVKQFITGYKMRINIRVVEKDLLIEMDADKGGFLSVKFFPNYEE
jgi:hypothetical protein